MPKTEKIKIAIEGLTLKQLKAKFINREFAIPEIQRNYVWDKRKVCKLMDSIFKNYPIGIGLVWTAKYDQALNIRPNNKTIVPPFNKRAKSAELIIDGQQRLSTLYGILFEVGEKSEAGSLINFNDLYFNCYKKSKERFLFSKKSLEDTKGYVKFSTLVNTKPSVLQKRLNLMIWELKEAEVCYNIFHSYKFYLLNFSGLRYDDVREIFIRINSAGMTVSKADTLFAKASKVKLRDHMLDTRRGLKHGYNDVSVDAMQNTLGLAYGAMSVGSKAFNKILKKIEENKKNGNFAKTWKQLQKGYEQSVDFLVNYLKLDVPELLPSQNIYSMLSYFFYLKKSKPTSIQINEIKKWFWHTACGERYSGARFNKNIPADIKFFRKLAKKENTKYIIDEKISRREFLESDYKKSSTSSTKAYFLLLRNMNPKYLVNGEFMLLNNPSSLSNRKDRHHIFPRAYLKKYGVKEIWINSIVNICYLAADENQSISDTPPSKYLSNYKTYKHFQNVMKSCMIPCSKNNLIWDSNLKKAFISFLNERGKLIINKIEKLAGEKIFDKTEEIKRIS